MIYFSSIKINPIERQEIKMVDPIKEKNFDYIFSCIRDVNMEYQSKEYVKKRIYDDSNDLKKIVDCLITNNVESMKKLNEKGIKFGHFKEFNARMAIYYGNADMLIYLIESKQINRDLNICLGQLATREFLKQLYQKGLFNNKNTYGSSLARWFQELSNIHLDEITRVAEKYIHFEAFCNQHDRRVLTYERQNSDLIGMTFQELST